jgi:ABC-type multidrug transport system fused ATPase/permease subunit
MSSFGPVTALASLGTTLQATVASGARVLQVIDETPETEDITGQREIAFNGAAADHVTFSYDAESAGDDSDHAQFLGEGRQKCLEDISFTYKPDAKPDRPAMRNHAETFCRAGMYFDNVCKLTVKNVTLKGNDGDDLIAKNVGELIRD